MRITKCDACKKVVKAEEISLRVETKKPHYHFASFVFCGICGKSLKDFLKKKRLLKIPKVK